MTTTGTKFTGLPPNRARTLQTYRADRGVAIAISDPAGRIAMTRIDRSDAIAFAAEVLEAAVPPTIAPSNMLIDDRVYLAPTDRNRPFTRYGEMLTVRGYDSANDRLFFDTAVAPLTWWIHASTYDWCAACEFPGSEVKA